MNRLKYLKSVLTGVNKPPETDQEKAWFIWCNNHEPLLSPSLMSLYGRHINNFLVGSDPEFAFSDGRHRLDAYSCGLKVGLAAGCDQNERLVELRPWPSVSAVDHIAGVLCALRWLRRTSNPVVIDAIWRAGAFFNGDGLGGHVHFGRKRPTRTEEVAALDGLAVALKASGLFPVEEWNRRIEGDNLAQHYGAPGDFRVQKHGYEYRSLPSWLTSPTVAFISVALSKLAVLDPSVTVSWKQLLQSDARNKLRGLAKLFKGLDDDAYLLYHVLTRNGDKVFEVTHNQDFSPEWGFTKGDKLDAAEQVWILPSSIQPDPAELIEMREHLLTGYPLSFRAYPPTFKTEVPPDFIWMPRVVHPGRRSGYGDLLHNLVIHSKTSVHLEHTNREAFSVEGMIPSTWSVEEIHKIKEMYPGVAIHPVSNTSGTSIIVGRHMCQAMTIGRLKELLTETGLFPIWTVETVQPKSHLEWLSTHSRNKKQKGWRDL